MTGCWEWTGSLTAQGYGRVRFASKDCTLHRLIFKLHTHIDINGLDVHHTCENRKCCNPLHLKAMSRSEHIETEHSQSKKTVCKSGHVYDEANTYYRKDREGRECRSCQKIRRDKRRAAGKVRMYNKEYYRDRVRGKKW